MVMFFSRTLSFYVSSSVVNLVLFLPHNFVASLPFLLLYMHGSVQSKTPVGLNFTASFINLGNLTWRVQLAKADGSLSNTLLSA